MYATLDMHFKKPIRRQAFIESLQPSSDVAAAVSQTTLVNDPGSAISAIYAVLDRSTALLIFPTGEQGLQVHLEAVLARSSIVELKEQVDRWLVSLNDAAKNSKQKVDNVSVTIYAEDNRITKGEPRTLVRGMWRKLKNDFLGDILLAVTPVVVMIYNGVSRNSVFSVLAASALALILWIGVHSFRQSRKVAYEDV